MITGLNESKTMNCKRKFDGRECNSNQNWNNGKCQCECKNLKEHHVCKKNYISSPATCSCKNGKYLAILLTVQ